MAKLNQFLAYLMLSAIRFYRYFLSPIFGTCCRFYPSCSLYASQAIQKHGIGYGSFLMGKRLLKCHPWHPGGVDQVP